MLLWFPKYCVQSFDVHTDILIPSCFISIKNKALRLDLKLTRVFWVQIHLPQYSGRFPLSLCASIKFRLTEY